MLHERSDDGDRALNPEAWANGPRATGFDGRALNPAHGNLRTPGTRGAAGVAAGPFGSDSVGGRRTVPGNECLPVGGPVGDTKLRVSVVVTVRNEGSRLAALLDALDRQTLAKDRYELIVVDDASEDNTLSLARGYAGARVISAPRPIGLPSGRNVGIRASLADVIAFTDGDCQPDPEWLERGVARFEDPDVGILAGGILMPLGDRPTLAAMVDASVFLNQVAYVKAGFGSGANLWIRRSVFEVSGLFNENVGMYGDEAELCMRAVSSGVSLVYAPEVSIVHPPRRRTRDVARKSFRQGMGGAAHRRFGRGPFSRRRPLYRDVRAYLPRPCVSGIERLHEQSVHPGRLRRAALLLSQYFFVRVPQVAGDIVGEVRYRVGVHHTPPPLGSAEGLVASGAEREQPLGLGNRRID